MSDRIKSWLFVSVQAVLLTSLIFVANENTAPMHFIVLAGRILEVSGIMILGVSICNLRKSLTALPLPTENGVLQVHGLYRYVRHPMYVGVLVLALGIAVSSGSIMKYLLVLMLYVLFSFKARYEEKLLLAKYQGYKSYMRKTRRFVPAISKIKVRIWL